MTVTYKRTLPLKDVILAIYMCIPAINVILVSFLPSLSGRMMAWLYILVAFMFLLIWMLGTKHRIVINKDNISLLVITFYIIVVYVFSLIRKTTDLSIYEFAVYPLLPMALISRIDFDYARTIRICPCLTVWGLLNINGIFAESNNAISMGLSYAFMPPIIFSLVYFYTDRRNKVISIFSLLHIFYLYRVIIYGSRGPLLSIIVCFLVLWVLQQKDNNVKISWFRVILITIILFIFALSFVEIISTLNKILVSHGIRIQSFNKILLLSQTENLDNGRKQLQKLAWEYILNRPFLGYGVSTFTFYTSQDYPHNFILQCLFEFGVVGTVILFYPLIKGIIKTISINKDKLVFVIAIISASVIGALFSGNMWRNALLWFSFAIVLKFYFEKKKGKDENTVTFL